MKIEVLVRSAYGSPWHKAVRYSSAGLVRVECGVRTSRLWHERDPKEVPADEARCARCFKKGK